MKFMFMVVSDLRYPNNQQKREWGMKTEAIKESIVNNYKILSAKSKVKSTENNVITTWGLNYRKNDKPIGFVNELGLIQRKKAKIEIKDNEIRMLKKPFFSTWNKTLKNINEMLETIITNLNNQSVVSKKYVKILCFPKEFIDKLSKIRK